MTLKDRLLKGWNGVLTAVGVVAAVLVEIGMAADFLPKDSRLHAIAVACAALGAALTVPKKTGAPAALILIAGSLLLASPARAQTTATFDGTAFSSDQPGGLLPQAGVCFNSGKECLQPAVTVLPYVIDFRSGNVAQNIGFGFGYALVFPKALAPSLIPGIEILGGTQTGGGWNAALLPRLGALRCGVVVTHKPGVTYAGLGFGVGI
jgi:hypothetical protein